jgi:hypothetical protein
MREFTDQYIIVYQLALKLFLAAITMLFAIITLKEKAADISCILVKYISAHKTLNPIFNDPKALFQKFVQPPCLYYG